MKKVEVILKVTEACNLRCKYCYECDREYPTGVFPLDKLEALLRLLRTGYNLIHIIWHGGEPMLAGLAYFKEAMDVERRVHIESGVVIENSIQTNGTLIDKSWAEFFRENGFRVGVSFDGADNERFRGATDRARAGMQALRDASVSFGCNAVVADADYDLAANYAFFRREGIGFDFSRMLAEGGAKVMRPMDAKTYADALCRLYDYWITDTEGVSVRTFALYVNMAVGGKYRICSSCSCHTKYLSVSPDGTLYNCGRESMGHYPFGKIEDFAHVNEIFASEGARALIAGSIARREKCKAICPDFALCAGGCADVAIVEGGLSEIPAEYCMLFRTVYGHVKASVERLLAEKTPLSSLNPAVRGILARTLSPISDTAKAAEGETYL